MWLCGDFYAEDAEDTQWAQWRLRARQRAVSSFVASKNAARFAREVFTRVLRETGRP